MSQIGLVNKELEKEKIPEIGYWRDIQHVFVRQNAESFAMDGPETAIFDLNFCFSITTTMMTMMTTASIDVITIIMIDENDNDDDDRVTNSNYLGLLSLSFRVIINVLHLDVGIINLVHISI